MTYLSINLLDPPSDRAFDPAGILRRVVQEFPGTRVEPGDPLEAQARAAQSNFPNPSPAMQTVIDALWRDARTQGPAYAFAIPGPDGMAVKGVVKRHLIQFGFDEPINQALLQLAREFLLSLVPGNSDVEIEVY